MDNVTLPPELERFAAEAIAAGRTGRGWVRAMPDSVARIAPWPDAQARPWLR